MKTIEIIPWNQQIICVNGAWVRPYQKVYSVSAWVKTPEQKRKPKEEE